MKKHTIWSNYNLDIEDGWREAYAEFLEINDIDDDPEDEDAIYEYMVKTNAEYLGDERMNLDHPLSGRILVIADLGLWGGRKQGFKIISERNLNAFLQFGYDYAEFYGDGYDIRGTEWHHDGTNYYLYRVIREDRHIENLLEVIYNGEEISRRKLNYYTRSLYKYVKQIYGWR